MKKLFTFLIAMLACISVFAEQKTVTFDFTKPETWGKGTSSNSSTKGDLVVGETLVVDDVTFTNVINGSTNTRFWSGDLRIYNGAQVMVSVPEGSLIKKIGFVGTFVGTSSDKKYSNKTWSDENGSQSVIFNITGTCKMTSMTVTYEEASTTELVAPELKIGGVTKEAGEYTFNNDQTVELSCKTTDSEIYYSIDGVDAVKYENPFTINSSCSLSIYSKLGETDSDTKTYTFNMVAAKPVISPVSEEDVFGAPQTVTITCATEGAKIYYAVTESNPTEADFIEYSEPFLLKKSLATVTAYATKDGYTDSGKESADYFIELDAPTFSQVAKAEGEYFNNDFELTLSAGEGVDIYYTTDPSVSENDFSKYSGAFTVSGNTTVRAYVKVDDMESKVAEQTYNFKVADPTFSVAGGTYVDAQTVTISSATEGATLTYMVGDEINEDVTPVTLNISEDTEISVVASKLGYDNSEEVTATYKFATVSADVSIDFVEYFASLETGWTNSYTSHTVENDVVKVYFGGASKQSSTINDRPVLKNATNSNYIDATMADGTMIATASIGLKQWGSKAKTVTCYAYDSDGNKTTLSPTFSFDGKTTGAEANPLWIMPANTVKVRFDFDTANNQIGVSSITLGGLWKAVENLEKLSEEGESTSNIAVSSTMKVVDVDGTNVTVVDGTNVYVLKNVAEGTYKSSDRISDVVVTLDAEGNATLVSAKKLVSEYATLYSGSESVSNYEYVYFKGANIKAGNIIETADGVTINFREGRECYNDGEELTDRAIFGYFEVPAASPAKHKAPAAGSTFVMYCQFATSYLGVDGIAVDAAKQTRIFNLQGVEFKCGLNELAPGLYIVNGKKVLVK